MALTGNAGEWSELYAHLKLLNDWVLYPCNGKLDKITDYCYPILQIIRNEKDFGKYVYILEKDSDNVLIYKNDSEDYDSVSKELFLQHAELLLSHIKGMKQKEKSHFLDVDNFANKVHMHKLKCTGSSAKGDIQMLVEDRRSAMPQELGFSIKSKLGGASTLFNANKNGTNFCYELNGVLSKEQIDEFNNIENFEDKFSKLSSWGIKVVFKNIIADTFYNNLTYIDPCLISILSESLIAYYSHAADSSDTKDIIEYVKGQNPCNFDLASGMDFYEHKMKQFLISAALGMTANTKWNGLYDANGGYIVVKEDGDIVCVMFYDKNKLEDYLFDNTAFDTPSTTRHNHGNIEIDANGAQILKLNLQIRFIHRKTNRRKKSK